MTANNIENDFKSLREEMTQIRGDLSDLARILRTLVGHGEEEVHARLHDAAEKVNARARDATRNLAAEIEERPLSSAVVAFAAGIALGTLLRSRN